jgi:hypothetical protein
VAPILTLFPLLLLFPLFLPVHPLVFILVMRFLRRCEGVDASRKVFLGCRRHPSVTYHTFLYAAYAEHHIHQDLAKAQAIYSVGMKLYGERNDGAYLRRYLAFLHETNDQQNLRLNFGRLLLTESAEQMEREMGQQMTKTERLQMRKAHAQAALASTSSAAAGAGAGNVVHREAEDDPAIAPDDWWAHVNALLPTSARRDQSTTSSDNKPSWRERAQDREGQMSGGLGGSGGSSSTVLPSSTLLSLWSSYVSFERDTASELAVLQRAEQKRDEKLAIRYSHRIVQWLDRWRFLDLWPASRAMRQTIDRVVRLDQATLTETLRSELNKEAERVALAQGAPSLAAAAAAAAATDADASASTAQAIRRRGVLTRDPAVVSALKQAMICPDPSRLSSFTHGGAAAGEGERAALRARYGGAPPEQILNILSVLPPAHLFTGPFVLPDIIIQMLQQIPDADSSSAPPAGGAAVAAGAGGRGRKGKRKGRDDDEDEEEAAAAAAAAQGAINPADDLYRKRQQQKMAKLQE